MCSQLDGSKNSFPLDGIFSAFIDIGLNRDIEESLYQELSFSLIGEILFDQQDKLFIVNYSIFLAGKI